MKVWWRQARLPLACRVTNDRKYLHHLDLSLFTVQHVEEWSQARLSKTVPGEPQLPDGGDMRENPPPRRQQGYEPSVSDATVRQVPRGDLIDRRLLVGDYG